jgi:hypothetical protein
MMRRVTIDAEGNVTSSTGTVNHYGDEVTSTWRLDGDLTFDMLVTGPDMGAANDEVDRLTDAYHREREADYHVILDEDVPWCTVQGDLADAVRIRDDLNLAVSSVSSACFEIDLGVSPEDIDTRDAEEGDAQVDVSLRSIVQNGRDTTWLDDVSLWPPKALDAQVDVVRGDSTIEISASGTDLSAINERFVRVIQDARREQRRVHCSTTGA